MKVLPNKHDDIEGVRIIRDPETLVGKGIGYLLLKDRDAVMKALSLHQVFIDHFSFCLHLMVIYLKGVVQKTLGSASDNMRKANQENRTCQISCRGDAN